MKPEIPRSSLPGLYLLGVLNALKAASMVVFADGLANAIMASIEGRPVNGPLGVAAAAVVLRAAMVWAVQASAKRTGLGAKEKLRAELTRNWLDKAGTKRTEAAGGASVLASNGLDALDGYYNQYLPALVSAATVPLVIGTRILNADWVSALIVVLTIPLIPIFMALIGWYTEEKVSAATGALLRLSGQLAELARGLPVLIGLRRAKEQRAALDQLGEAYRSTTMATLRVAFWSALALELIATLSVALVAVFIGVRLVYGQLGLGTGLLVLILVADCYLPFRELGSAFHASDDGREALRRSRKELAAPAGRRLPEHSGPDAAGLQVERLSVRYLDRAVPALNGVRLRIPAGSLCAISGPSGCGKSTLLGVLAGTVTSADAEMSGSVHGLDPEKLAWLPQNPGSTETTAADELVLWGASGEAQISAALAAVGLAGREAQHPASLSPGQFRRLALARILLRVEAGATVVLVDEPTAHVDAASARLIEAALVSLRGRVTVLLVSHDPRVVALADQHLELAGPVIPEFRTQPAADAPAVRPAGIPAARELSAAEAGAESQSDSDIGSGQARSRAGSTFRIWLRVLQPWRPGFLGAVCFGVLAALAGLALTALSGWLIVRASQQPPILYLLTAIVGVRFFGLLRAVSRYLERLSTHQAVFAAADRLRGRLWDALAKTLPGNRALGRGEAVLPRLIGEVDELRNLMPRVLLPPVTAVLASVAVLICTSLLFPQGFGLQLAVVLGAALAAPALALWADRRSVRLEQQQRDQLFRGLTVLLGAAAELRTNRVDGPLLARLSAVDRGATASAQRGAWAEGLAMAALTLFGCLAALGMVFIGAPLLGSGQLRPEVLVALVLLQLGLVDAFSPLVQSAPGLPLLRRMARSLGAQLQVPELPVVPVAAPGRAIRAEALAIGWQGSTVAEALEVDLASGDWLTVTGPSGSGKSTFLATLMGFTPVLGGRLAVNGKLAWCPQEAHLFNSSLRGNLALARAKADAPSAEEMTRVLTEVGLGEWLGGLSRGLDTPLGVAGGLVSGGQRQRIAVARALLTRADIVLLDEPTAHLDRASAAELMADLRRSLASKAVVLITHHLADRSAGDAVLDLGTLEPARR
ncbi:MAG: thiol reductant ABC exporter subunit CydC [Renibacterium sp.]|nr:thiol reductant ABC exporter subunit CydC [Renibacterium sp.]